MNNAKVVNVRAQAAIAEVERRVLRKVFERAVGHYNTKVAEAEAKFKESRGGGEPKQDDPDLVALLAALAERAAFVKAHPNCVRH